MLMAGSNLLGWRRDQISIGPSTALGDRMLFLGFFGGPVLIGIGEFYRLRRSTEGRRIIWTAFFTILIWVLNVFVASAGCQLIWKYSPQDRRAELSPEQFREAMKKLGKSK